jgi:uncharacterized membrane protein (DUF485 family)
MRAVNRNLLDSPEFHGLVARRWRMSLLLTALLFVLYYGYIILIAVNRPLMSRPLSPGSATTVGIPIGAAVIAGAWLLTAIYVVWANRYFDKEAARLRGLLLRPDVVIPGRSNSDSQPD